MYNQTAGEDNMLEIDKLIEEQDMTEEWDGEAAAEEAKMDRDVQEYQDSLINVPF